MQGDLLLSKNESKKVLSKDWKEVGPLGLDSRVHTLHVNEVGQNMLGRGDLLHTEVLEKYHVLRFTRTWGGGGGEDSSAASNTRCWMILGHHPQQDGLPPKHIWLLQGMYLQAKTWVNNRCVHKEDYQKWHRCKKCHLKPKNGNLSIENKSKLQDKYSLLNSHFFTVSFFCTLTNQ